MGKQDRLNINQICHIDFVRMSNLNSSKAEMPYSLIERKYKMQLNINRGVKDEQL